MKGSLFFIFFNFHFNSMLCVLLNKLARATKCCLIGVQFPFGHFGSLKIGDNYIYMHLLGLLN